ncbi:hypothetical protein SLE2022_129630 [Rubroshorea leprosula]
MGIQDLTEKEYVTLIFTYGTLKRGFSNHILMQELMRTGDAAFKGTYLTVEKYPLVCGPYRVPFLLNMPGSGNRIMGELYAVSAQGLARLDELEGTTRGHYERLPILILPAENEDGDFGIDGEILSGCSGETLSRGGVTCAEAYYAHRSYEKEMWRRNEGKGFVTYSEKEAKGYVKRKDRPQNLTFLDHIRIFVSSPSD